MERAQGTVNRTKQIVILRIYRSLQTDIAGWKKHPTGKPFTSGSGKFVRLARHGGAARVRWTRLGIGPIKVTYYGKASRLHGKMRRSKHRFATPGQADAGDSQANHP